MQGAVFRAGRATRRTNVPGRPQPHACWASSALPLLRRPRAFQPLCPGLLARLPTARPDSAKVERRLIQNLPVAAVLVGLARGSMILVPFRESARQRKLEKNGRLGVPGARFAQS
jgi:hypothetical protein|eukprot:COSAG06_NODE_2081_length_7638_cov_33.282266_4_plen_115_part_00